MQEIKYKKRFRLKRGPKYFLIALLIVGLGYFFYDSQQPKVRLSSTMVLEYGATNEEAIATLVNTDKSRYDTIQIDQLDTGSVTSDDETRTGSVTATYNERSKTISFTYTVADTKAPVITLPSDTFDYTDVTSASFNAFVESVSANDPVDGVIEVFFRFPTSNTGDLHNKEDFVLITKDLILALKHPIEVVATDKYNNTSVRSFELSIGDGALLSVKSMTQPEKDQLISDFKAKYSGVYEMGVDTPLFESGVNERIYPASMTKTLTLLAALELIESGVSPAWNNNMAVTLDSEYTIPSTINWVYNVGASNAGFSGGDTVTIRDILYGIILPSGADATYAISYALTGEQDGIVKVMNQVAQRLGMTQSHFVNPTGLYDAEHYTTVNDLSVLIEEAWKNETFKTIYTAEMYVVESSTQRSTSRVFESYSLGVFKLFDMPYVTGTKSGFIDESQLSLISVVEKNDHVYIVIVNNTQKDERSLNAVTDSIHLIQKYIP